MNYENYIKCKCGRMQLPAENRQTLIDFAGWVELCDGKLICPKCYEKVFISERLPNIEVDKH
jgi:hypothetical protein